MLGKILTINKNSATLQINKDAGEINDLINLHVVFEDERKKILGEIKWTKLLQFLEKMFLTKQ